MDSLGKRSGIYREIEDVCLKNGKHSENRFDVMEDGLILRRAEFVRAAAYYVRSIEAIDAGAFK